MRYIHVGLYLAVYIAETQDGCIRCSSLFQIKVNTSVGFSEGATVTISLASGNEHLHYITTHRCVVILIIHYMHAVSETANGDNSTPAIAITAVIACLALIALVVMVAMIIWRRIRGNKKLQL